MDWWCRNRITLLVIALVTQFCSISHANQMMLDGGTRSTADTLTALRFSDQWTCVGPFRIGTREAPWGADPLEIYGGFRNLSYHPNATFRSALAEGGVVAWSIAVAGVTSTSTASTAHLDISFSKTNWSFLRSIYGWAALQHQGWARGSLVNGHSSEQRVTLFTDGILELWINGEHYWGGDLYSFRRVPIVVTLIPGNNQIDCRLIYDVRAMGGNEPPTISMNLEAHAGTRLLHVAEDTAIIPDIVNGKLPSSFASIICRNEAESALEILSIEADGVEIEPLSALPFRLVEGQSRPVAFKITLTPQVEDSVVMADDPVTLRLLMSYRLPSYQPNPVLIHRSSVVFKSRSLFEPHKFTFQHPSGSVSYAILRPPSERASETKRNSLPVLLNLHGAGVEADSHQVRHMLDESPDLEAWTVFPTGMSPNSGDDWHTWGFGDVKAAIEAIPTWAAAMGWKGPDVDVGKWLVSGHSNGGQGVWYILTHHPDNAIVAAPVSGYTSIQNYVPYVMWHEADPRASAVIQLSLASFRHELFTPNFEGIPILQQHGSADDNVPAYHSRLMSELLADSSLPSTYEEMPGKGHWYEGVMTTTPLKRFYDTQLKETEINKGPLPTDFEIICPHTYDLTCRRGVCVDQLETPDRLGRFNVHRKDEMTWEILTSNIHRFHLDADHIVTAKIERLVVDGQELKINVHDKTKTWLVKARLNQWQVTSDSDWMSLSQRHGKQIGAMDAILRTRSTFSVRTSQKEFKIALQLSQNMLQYFGADSNIVFNGDESAALHETGGNEIIVVEGDPIPDSALAHFPLQVSSNSINIRQPEGYTKVFEHRPGLGAIFIRPLPDERLELIIWGTDADGLRRAARLAPMLTGVGQPDFVIVGRDAEWKGHAGVLAMGFLNYQWNISQASFIM